MKTVELQTKCGKIQGIDGENCFEFRGIKYANAKRWEYPQVIEKWQGVLMQLALRSAHISTVGLMMMQQLTLFIIMNSETV